MHTANVFTLALLSLLCPSTVKTGALEISNVVHRERRQLVYLRSSVLQVCFIKLLVTANGFVRGPVG